MKRRTFLKGVVGLLALPFVPAAAKALPLPVPTDRYEFKTYEFGSYGNGFTISSNREMKAQAQALAHSMMETKEKIAADVFNRAFSTSYRWRALCQKKT